MGPKENNVYRLQKMFKNSFLSFNNTPKLKSGFHTLLITGRDVIFSLLKFSKLIASCVY